MEVKRSDMVKWAEQAQLGTEKEKSAVSGPTSESRVESKPAVTVDAMRSKVLSLQQEIRELQTGLSMRQIQLGFLNQVNEGSGWQKELKRFMGEQFPAVQLQMSETQSADEFKSEAAQIVSNLRTNLIKKEIQIQNILSAGIFEAGTEAREEPQLDNSKIVKDFNESRDIFNKLRPESVKGLVN